MQIRATVLAALLCAVTADFYSSRYDDFDVKPLLENDRILKNYIRCFLDEGPCTPEGKDFKKVIPEALETKCGKCTYKQRQLIRQVIRALLEKQPQAWQALVHKYDEDRKYEDEFNRFLVADD